MRAFATTTWRATAILLAAFAIHVAPPADAQSPLRAAQTASEDETAPPEAQSPAESTDEPGQAAAQPAEQRQPPEFGVSRRIDPFDDTDEVPDRPAPAGVKSGVVVCVAGCDKPRDAAVRSRNKLE